MTAEKIIKTDTKKCRKKLKFENYKYCLETTQHQNETKHLEKIKLTYIVSFVAKENINN